MDEPSVVHRRAGGSLISVVVPTRDRRALLERLLGQLLRAEVAGQYEVIVVDEASSDSTPELLEPLAADGRIRLIRNDPPVRLPAARNAGLAAATGRHVAWIDDDDLTSPDRLIRQRDAMQNSGARWSCCARVDIDDDLDVIGARACPPRAGLIERLLAFNCLPTAAQGLLVERSLAVEVGGYDTAFDSAEDWEFCIRLALVAEPHLMDEPLVGYRTGAVSMSTDSDRMERAIAAVYAKHADAMAARGVAPDWASVHQSLLAADLLTSRRRAARRVVKLLRSAPTARNLARCAAVLAWPKYFDRQAADRRRSQVPAAWVREARAWLVDVRPTIDSS